MKRLTISVCLLALLGGGWDASADELDGFSTAAYAEVLARFVTDEGAVRYAELQSDRALLDEVVDSLAGLDPDGTEGWGEQALLAFWINAYNALTLKVILDNYPIRGSGLSVLRYPASSIRQIPRVWSAPIHWVMGREVSLDQIEHEVLRKDFSEPRSHVALVCAAVGCPPLRREPYDGARLDLQLDDQAHRYLASPAGLRLDGDKVLVSKIFRWFAEDFGGSDGVRALLLRHAPDAARSVLAAGARVAYLGYDWSLNEADGPAASR